MCDELVRTVEGDWDSFPVVGVWLVGVPVPLYFVGEEGRGSQLLLGCLDPFDDVLQLVVEPVEEVISARAVKRGMNTCQKPL